MSRIGSSSIKIPEGVTVSQANKTILVKGKNGELSVDTHDLIDVIIDNNEISFSSKKANKAS